MDASEPWAANVLCVGGPVCVSAAFPRTAEMLAARGYDVRAVEVSEFAKAEGGMTCMSLLFRQPEHAKTVQPGRRPGRASGGSPRRSLPLGARTLVMGVINLTPDSFSDGGRWFTRKRAWENAERMIENGADIIDFGGESTRPGAQPVSGGGGDTPRPEVHRRDDEDDRPCHLLD